MDGKISFRRDGANKEDLRRDRVIQSGLNTEKPMAAEAEKLSDVCIYQQPSILVSKD
jgi:hypothetical protein